MPSAWPRTGQAIRPERLSGIWPRSTLSLRVNLLLLLIPLDATFDLRGEVHFFWLAMTDFLTEEFWHDQPGDLAHPAAGKGVAELLSVFSVMDYIFHLCPSVVVIDHIPVKLPVGSDPRPIGRIGGVGGITTIVDVTDGGSITDLVLMGPGPVRERITFDILHKSGPIDSNALDKRVILSHMKITVRLLVIDIHIRIDAPGPGRG